jgi:hypothetical protein
MTIDSFLYYYGIIVDEDLIDEKIQKQFPKLEIFTIAHDINPIELDQKSLKNKIIFGKLIYTFNTGTGKLPKIQTVKSDTKKLLTDLISLLKLEIKATYILISNDCNCCS